MIAFINKIPLTARSTFFNNVGVPICSTKFTIKYTPFFQSINTPNSSALGHDLSNPNRGFYTTFPCDRLRRSVFERRMTSGAGIVSQNITDLGSGIFIKPVPILNDNYSYLIIDRAAGVAAAVDPAEPNKLIKAAQEEGVAITCVLTTHHHADHSGGNADIAGMINGLEIIGSAYEQIPMATKSLRNNETYNIPGSEILHVRAIVASCHTRGHIMFFLESRDNNGSKPALFSGDTLFVAGCGAFFEGNANDMVETVDNVFKKLPRDTLIFCGHEYTVKNLRFAASVEPQNVDIAEKLCWARMQLEQSLYTVPSRLDSEFRTNPFLRIDEPTIQEAAQTKAGERVETMAVIRRMKNQFQ